MPIAVATVQRRFPRSEILQQSGMRLRSFCPENRMTCDGKVDRFLLPSAVVEQGVLSDAATAVSRLIHSVGSRLLCLWLLGLWAFTSRVLPSTRGKSINLTEVWLMDDTGCRGFFLAPVATYHRQYEALRAFFIEGRRLHDIAQQFGYRETSLRSMVCRFRAQVQAGA